jgi:hypothetical protein
MLDAALTRAMGSLLVDVRPTDPVTFAAIASRARRRRPGGGCLVCQ